MFVKSYFHASTLQNIRRQVPKNRITLSGVMFLMAFLGSSIEVSQSAASADIEILSKEDAHATFAMTREQWKKNLDGAVSQGVARRHLSPNEAPGMYIEQPGGMLLIVRPLFDVGKSRPIAVQVVVGYRKPFSEKFTDKALADRIDKAKRDLAPEYHVLGDVTRMPTGITIIFMISETTQK